MKFHRLPLLVSQPAQFHRIIDDAEFGATPNICRPASDKSYTNPCQRIPAPSRGDSPSGTPGRNALKSRMPIHVREPWREQYLRDITSLTDVNIPTHDREAFNRNPRHRCIYDRLLIAQSQGLPCGAHDVRPTRFPVFCTAVANFDGRESARP